VREGPFEISKTIEHFLGFFYIQSLSSMLPVEFLDTGNDHTILDLCSAPGSKTTQAGIILKNKGAILANDVNIDRLRALSHNLDRVGLLNVMVTKIKGEKIGELFFEQFDRVILDPPCSSLGTLAKNRSILKWWHPREIDRFYNIQRELFKSAIKALKPGGKMVYSTCTLSVKENEFLISEMVENYPLEILKIDELKIPFRKGIRKFKNLELLPEIERTIRIYPQDIDSEGFYIAVLIKNDALKREKRFYLKEDKKIVDPDNQELKKAFSYLENEFGISETHFKDFLFSVKKDEIWVFSRKLGAIKNPFDLRRGLRFLRKHKKGYKLTTNFIQLFGKFIKNRKLELEDFKDAKDFLEGRDIRISSPFKGQVVVFYKDYALGVGSVGTGILKSQIPKSRRIFEIGG
jgi:16S rRNA (cytosine1407-C5)-methyltransferase